MLRFIDEKIDEDILCELGKIKQKATSVRKYVEKLKDLTRRLEAQPSNKNLRAWFMNGSSNKRLKSAEITNATTSFEEMVASALKMESSKEKKHRKETIDESESSARSSFESEESIDFDKKKKYKAGQRKSSRPDSLESSESEEDDKRNHGKKKSSKKSLHDKAINLLTKKIEELTA